jgi:energy-coupling factor transport system permease protein
MRAKRGSGNRRSVFRQVLVNDSPLRLVDPRTKLALSLFASLAVMLPLRNLAIFIGVYLVFVTWARLLPEVLRQVWRIRYILLVLFILDTWLINLELAVTVTLRLALLTGVFAMFFATTTSRELGLALEALRLPYRYAFSLSLAMSSLGLLEEELRAIYEAQAARGVLPSRLGWRRLLEQLRDLIALTVPAVMLATRRAWAVTEAAYARGFDSPHRLPYHVLHFRWMDWSLVASSLAGMILLFLWR